MDEAARAVGPARPVYHPASAGDRTRVEAKLNEHAIDAARASGDTTLVRRGADGHGDLAACAASSNDTSGLARLRLRRTAWHAGRALDQPGGPRHRVHAATA